MNLLNVKRFPAVILVFFVLLTSCFKEEFDSDKLSSQVELTPGIVLPLGTGNLTIADFLEPNDTIRFIGDSIEIYYSQDSLFSFQLEDFFDIPDQEQQLEQFELGESIIDPDTVIREITLDELTQDMTEPTKSNIRSKDGTSDIFPPIPNQNLGNYSVDSMDNFTWLEMSSGTLEMTIENNYPVEITTLTVTMKNTNDDSEVATFQFTNLQPGESQTRTADLTDVTMTNKVYASVTNVNSPGSAPNQVEINLTDNVRVIVVSSDMVVKRGRAVLPFQVFDGDTTNIPLEMGEGEEKITLLELETGIIDYRLYSYIEENIIYEVILPSTTRDGEIVTQNIVLNKLGETSGEIDLAGSVTTVNEDNTIPVIYSVSLDPSNNMVTFDFRDSVNYESVLQVNNINVAAVEGYFGQDIIEIEQNEFDLDLEFITNFQGSFGLTNPTIDFVYTNSYGIPIDLSLDLIGMYDNSDNVNLIPPVQSIEMPEDRDAEPIDGVLRYDKTTVPDIVNFLRFPPPDKITYSGMVTTNPEGETGPTNFVKSSSNIDIGLEMKLPLEIIADNIIIQDSIKFDLTTTDNEDGHAEEDGFTDEIELKQTILHYKISNGFPLDLGFDIVLYDSITDTKYDTVNVDFLVASPVDERGVVIEESIEEVEGEISLDAEFMDALNNNANKLILIGRLSTYKENDTPVSVKILTSYAVDFKVGIEAKVAIKTNVSE